MSKIVIGIFDNAGSANDARQELLDAGFIDSEIDIANGKADHYYADSDEDDRRPGESKIGHFFRTLFNGEDHEANRYTTVAEKNWTLTVHARSSEDADRAVDILDDYNALDVNDHYDQHYAHLVHDHSHDTENDIGPGSGIGLASPMSDTYVDTDETTSGMVKDTDNEAAIDDNERVDDALIERREFEDESRTIPVIEEDVHVGKKTVDTGGVRLKSRIIEKPIEKHLRLREEHVEVNRKAVDREATDEELEGLRNETIDVHQRSEVPDVTRSARVVEEVSVNKTVDHRDETITDNARNSQVDIEDIDGKRQVNESW